MRRKSIDSALYTNTTVSPTKTNRSQTRLSYIITPKSRLSAQKTGRSNITSGLYMQTEAEEVDEGGDFNQEEYDAYHLMRRGYVSPLKGTEEDFFVTRLKDWLKLENHLEEVKEELIMFAHDFNPI